MALIASTGLAFPGEDYLKPTIASTNRSRGRIQFMAALRSKSHANGQIGCIFRPLRRERMNTEEMKNENFLGGHRKNLLYRGYRGPKSAVAGQSG